MIPRASMMQLDDSGTTLTVFKGHPRLLGDDIGLLDKKEHISTYDLTLASAKSTMKMTEDSLNVQTKSLSLIGMTGTDITPSQSDTTLDVAFSSIDLCAQNNPLLFKAPPNASLALNASEPKATLSAGAVAPAISSVEATQTALTLKSGASTELVLNSASLNMKAHAFKIEVLGSVAIECTQIKLGAASGFSVRTPLIQLG